MKSFQAFRLDTANQCLWRGPERVAIPPKPYDMLRYLVENAGRLVTQDELLQKLWPDTYVNPELIRKYILDIRKILGDRPDKPEFIETVTKRGYRFIASVVDEDAITPTSPAAIEDGVETIRSGPEGATRKLNLWKVVLTSVLAVVVAAAISRELGVARTGRTVLSSNETSIAVLPFADMSPDKDQEYFSDGLAEQLIHELAKKPGLKVVGRSSAFQFKGKNEDLRAVGRKLGVANVLEGSVRRDGNHLRVTAELIKADDGFQLWSQTYDREIKDIFTVQDEISRSTNEALQLKLLGNNGEAVPSRVRSANPEAYQAYLQASYFNGRGTGKEDLGKALAYSDAAIKLDDKYPPAWALRASVQNMMAQYGLTEVSEGYRKARDDAERAIALDSTSASAYLALARTQIFYDWDWDSANTCLRKAAALEPGNPEILLSRSHLSVVLGNLDEAIKLAEQAVARDPLRANAHLSLGYMLYLSGRYDEAKAELQRAVDLNPQAARVHVSLGKILIAEGKPHQALVEIEKEPSDSGKLTGQILVYSALGREQHSTAALAKLIAKHATDSAYQIARAYAFRGESDRSFEWLERAYKQRDSGLPDIKTDPLLKNLRHDPRYTPLLKKMRLPT
jgi:TolB-like protein/DNA-binding winged helix-turn-helix (wHTH) protein/thioredoxin-like negative regulator of GroEL